MLKTINKTFPLSILTLSIVSTNAMAETTLDAISVTATKESRVALDVPQSVEVVDEKTIEEKSPLNINEVIKTLPGVIAINKSGGYDSRLIIRGAGLKARYGVREIMVLRDGVPMTDPDSFTRFDFIDVDDMQSVEVYKGPGSIAAANASGGVLAINSRSAFDASGDSVKLGVGTDNLRHGGLRKTFELGEDDSIAVQASHRASDNSWREHNRFSTTQVSVKEGHFFKDDSTLETELSYQDTQFELPNKLNQTGFDDYLKTGKTQNDKAHTGSAFSQSARNSTTLFLNSRYKTQLSPSLKFEPQIYANRWTHFHPVTGFINDAQDNTVFGADLMFSRSHQLLGQPASQVFGITMRGEQRNDSDKYTYRDTVLAGSRTGSRIINVTSDSKGVLAQREDSNALLKGGYFMQTLKPSQNWSVDLGVRYDHLSMDTKGVQYQKYNYGTGGYAAGSGAYHTQADYDLFAPKVAATYHLSDQARLYASVSAAQQAPTMSELSTNRSYGKGDLSASTARQYEVGYKLASAQTQATLALYEIDLSDEIVAVSENSTTYYVNAGGTRKRGLEISLSHDVNSQWQLGGSGALQDYQYLNYVDSGNDYSGNQVRFIPSQQYSVFVRYHHQGWSARVEGLGFGDYYIDDANTEKYKGYQMVTNLMVSYQQQPHKIQLNVNNVADMRYAEEVAKDTRGNYSYTPGAPRSVQLTYRYAF
jgi:iron complex outermembrane receptor protein